ncbi:MAG TPA: molybdenum cofactor guanylyltransferase [Metalysinibacillus jejuensis]|uniref:Probable molybdenum cofactor guanylyltransferase n=1 Tax=Metalysinibacillus jejuensis TaxID=914327 RepID=A0A921T5U2_9BACL|nr:molybdenum cofactor guanylyltransferase [Metalysinibacillus jejuensis]
MSIAGVVLAGGQSSRYGQAKMFVTFEGEPLYKKSLHALRANKLSPLIIATNEKLRPYFLDSDVYFSLEPVAYEGPLAALHRVMTTYEADWFFVVASDMPYIQASFIKQLCSYSASDYDAIVPKQQTYIQPLAALYHRRLLSAITEALANQRRSMQAVLEAANVNYVPYPSDSPLFININRQQDWPKE